MTGRRTKAKILVVACDARSGEIVQRLTYSGLDSVYVCTIVSDPERFRLLRAHMKVPLELNIMSRDSSGQVKLNSDYLEATGKVVEGLVMRAEVVVVVVGCRDSVGVDVAHMVIQKSRSRKVPVMSVLVPEVHDFWERASQDAMRALERCADVSALLDSSSLPHQYSTDPAVIQKRVGEHFQDLIQGVDHSFLRAPESLSQLNWSSRRMQVCNWVQEAVGKVNSCLGSDVFRIGSKMPGSYALA